MNNIPKNWKNLDVSIAAHSARTHVRMVHLKTEKAVQTFQKQWKEQFPNYSPLQVGDSITVALNSKEITDPNGAISLYAPQELESLIKFRVYLTQSWRKLQDSIKKSSLFQTVSKYNFQWH